MLYLFDSDRFYLWWAFWYAKRAFLNNEVPVGALVVLHGRVIGWGYNKVELHKKQHAHAEMLALYKAAQNRGDWRLEDATLYVTLEPCLMCFGACVQYRVERIVFGAASPRHGYGSALTKLAALVPGVYWVNDGHSAALLQSFFRARRSQ